MARYRVYYYIVDEDDPMQVQAIDAGTVEVPDNTKLVAEESAAFEVAYDSLGYTRGLLNWIVKKEA